MIDVRKPLKRSIRIQTEKNRSRRIFLGYERLGNLCFVCGCLNNTLRGCDKRDVDAKDEDVDNFPYGVWLKASPMEMNVVVGVKTEVSFSSARRKLSCDAMDKGSPGDHLARNEGELKNGKHSEREPQLIKVSEVLKSLVECHIEKEEQLSIIRVDERILGLNEAEKIVPKVVICSGELMINYVEKTKVVQGKKDDETVFKRKN